MNVTGSATSLGVKRIGEKAPGADKEYSTLQGIFEENAT